MSKNKNLIQVLIGLTEQALLLTIAIATIGAAVIEIVRILSVMTVNLSDLFLLFIYAEVLGMVGVIFKLIPWLIVIALGVWFFRNYVYSPR